MLRQLFAAAIAIAVAAAEASGQSRAWGESAAQLVTPTGTIAGSLIVPSGAARMPLVVIIAGSGPTDRNGNGPMAGPNNLRQIAEGLADRGIASLRYDKRGVAGSIGAATSESNLRFDMYADDAAAWVKEYRGDTRFGPIVILGHSEGSLLGMLATQRAPADGLVSIAGVARRADRVLHDQLAAQLPPDLLGVSDTIMAVLVAGKAVDNPPPALAALFRASVQPYIISWLRYSGAEEVTRLTVPVMLVQGTNDIQVMPAEAEALARALPSAKLMMVQGMNHVCKITPAGRAEQMPSYSDPKIPLAPGLVDSIASFVKSVKK